MPSSASTTMGKGISLASAAVKSGPAYREGCVGMFRSFGGKGGGGNGFWYRTLKRRSSLLRFFVRQLRVLLHIDSEDSLLFDRHRHRTTSRASRESRSSRTAECTQRKLDTESRREFPEKVLNFKLRRCLLSYQILYIVSPYSTF